MEVKPGIEFLTGIERQKIQFQKQFRDSVLGHAEQVYQFSVYVVIDFELGGWLSQQDGTASTEHIDKAVILFRENRIENRQQISLVADAGYRGTNRLFHAPFIMETAGTVPAVR